MPTFWTKLLTNPTTYHQLPSALFLQYDDGNSKFLWNTGYLFTQFRDVAYQKALIWICNYFYPLNILLFKNTTSFEHDIKEDMTLLSSVLWHCNLVHGYQRFGTAWRAKGTDEDTAKQYRQDLILVIPCIISIISCIYQQMHNNKIKNHIL
jgi:hypothetical protein